MCYSDEKKKGGYHMGEYNLYSGSRAFEFNVRSNFNYPSHFERGAELLYVLDGRIRVTVEGRTGVLDKGDVAFIFPNQMHNYETTEDNYVFFMVFNPETLLFYNGILNKKEPGCPFISSAQVHEDIFNIIRSLIPAEVLENKATFSYKPDKGVRSSLSGETPEEYSRLSYDQGLLIGYFHIICSRLFPYLELKDAHFEDKELIIQKALTYIHNHYTESITRDHVAKAVGASRYYLSRIFTNKLNTNFNTYVNTLRTIQAKKLLESGASITEACFQSGFDSQSTFYRVFKEISGTTPKKYLDSL